jgi:tetratricopeptide (TPR) repeat protein
MTCPYLGTAERRSPGQPYASYRNRCYADGRPQRIAARHQKEYCLSGGHWLCPRFTATSADVSLPSEPVVRQPPQSALRQTPRVKARRGRSAVTFAQMASVLVVALVLCALGVCGMVVYRTLADAGRMPRPAPALAATTVTPIPSPIPSLTPSPTLTPTPTPTPLLTPVAEQVLLEPMTHTWQTWNNCGPATVAMCLSYLGRTETQAEVAAVLRPDPEDKNISPQEMAAYVRNLGLGATARINGRTAVLKGLLSNGIPVIVEQWHVPEGDPGMGHYRLVRGYSEADGVFIAHDSLTGPDEQLTYAAFDEGWRVFDRAYVIVYPLEKQRVVEALLGDDADDAAMYRHAVARAQEDVRTSGDAFAWFNLGSSYVDLGEYAAAADAYQHALEIGLPRRMLWYQFGPFIAYEALGEYQKVLDLSAGVLAHTPNIEELHYYRGRAYLGLDDVGKARAEFELAVQYNPHYAEAVQSLADLGR